MKQGTNVVAEEDMTEEEKEYIQNLCTALQDAMCERLSGLSNVTLKEAFDDGPPSLGDVLKLSENKNET